MIDLLSLMAFHAAYADTIDSDRLEQWPDFFAPDALYRITHVENEQQGLPAGIVWADSRAMATFGKLTALAIWPCSR